MGIPAVAVIVPIGILFFISGFIVNLMQAICFVLIRPLSKNTYRIVNRQLAEFLWLELIWVVDWWAGVKIQLFTDKETLHLMGKEHALVICNHRSDIDWLVGWLLCQRSGCLGSALAVMKSSSKVLPVIGWSMWFSEYLFLERNWAKDESTLKVIALAHILWECGVCMDTCLLQTSVWSQCILLYACLVNATWASLDYLQLGLQRLKDFPRPFWLALFVEGTRFTQAKLLAAQEYAMSTGLPVPRNVLIPRTKGFVSAVSNMRSFVPAIYDVTVAIPKSSVQPTMLGLFKGQSCVVQVHLKRHLVKDLPESEDDVAQWCRERFVVKDSLLDKHKVEDTFSDQELQDLGRPIKSLVVVISWACILIFWILKFLQWSSLLYSWKGIAISSCAMAVIAFLMQILLRFSQSERSTPAKIAPAKPNNARNSSETVRDKHQ